MASSSATEPSGRSPRGWLGWEFLAFLELFALCGFAFAQPVLDITGNSPEFFLFHRAEPGDILAMLAVFLLGPPLALWSLGALTRLAGPLARRTAQVVLVTGLLVVLAIQVGKPLAPLRGVALAVVAAAVAAGFLVAYLRLAAARSVLRMAAIGPLAFALLFVFVSPVSGVVLHGGDQTSSRPAAATGDHPPVVVLLFDEFPLTSLLGPDGMVDAARYPNFAALAGESTWYRNSTAVSDFTAYAMPAMMTGRYPTQQGAAPHYTQYPDNLFSLLGSAYQVEAFESITQLCKPWECESGRGGGTGLPGMLRDSTQLMADVVSPYDSERDPFAGFREPTVRERSGAEGDATFLFSRLAENQPARFHDFVRELRPEPAAGQRPTLHFLHLIVPHGPWTYLSSGMQYEVPPSVASWTWADTPREGGEAWLQLNWRRHQEQAQYVDRLLGETVRVLHESGQYDDALLAVTSDHGVSFSAGAFGRELDPALRSAPELMWVPTFIKRPHQTDGVVDDRNWETVDLLPTLADLAGFEVPWRTDGISALRDRRDGTTKTFHTKATVRHHVDGVEPFDRVLTGAVPELPAQPLADLIGRPLGEQDVTDRTEGRLAAVVENLAGFDNVRQASGTVPALVAGTLSEPVPDGTLVAVAVNGRIGAVVPVLTGDDGQPGFAALVTDTGLFTDGANRLDVLTADAGGERLRRLPVRGA